MNNKKALASSAGTYNRLTIKHVVIQCPTCSGHFPDLETWYKHYDETTDTCTHPHTLLSSWGWVQTPDGLYRTMYNSWDAQQNNNLGK